MRKECTLGGQVCYMAGRMLAIDGILVKRKLRSLLLFIWPQALGIYFLNEKA